MKCSPVNDTSLSWIYIGCKEVAKNLNELHAKNIRYILNVTPKITDGGIPNYHIKNQSFRYHRLPIYDNASENLSTYYEDAWEFIEMVRIREDGSLLVHCNQGISRSVTIVCAYAMKYFGLPLTDVLSQIQTSRPFAKPNDNFMRQLKDFESSLKASNDYIDPQKLKVDREGLNRKGKHSGTFIQHVYTSKRLPATGGQVEANGLSTSNTNTTEPIKKLKPSVGPTLPPWLMKERTEASCRVPATPPMMIASSTTSSTFSHPSCSASSDGRICHITEKNSNDALDVPIGPQLPAINAALEQKASINQVTGD